MSKTVEIKCDQCDADLTYTGNMVDWRVALVNERKATRPGAGAVTCMGISPAFDRDAHFCGAPCLVMWLDVNAPSAREQYQQMLKHRAWLATKMAPRAS